MEYRLVKQDAVCRVCKKELKRNEDMVVSHYCGMRSCSHILICPDCVEIMYGLIKGG